VLNGKLQESIRQNQLFKDFYMLAEFETTKRKQLFVVGTDHAIKFLTGNRACTSVFSGHKTLWEKFDAKYGSSIVKVCDYYEHHRQDVEIVDVRPLIPEFGK
jgi:hypothetical protein